MILFHSHSFLCHRNFYNDENELLLTCVKVCKYTCHPFVPFSCEEQECRMFNHCHLSRFYRKIFNMRNFFYQCCFSEPMILNLLEIVRKPEIPPAAFHQAFRYLYLITKVSIQYVSCIFRMSAWASTEIGGAGIFSDWKVKELECVKTPTGQWNYKKASNYFVVMASCCNFILVICNFYSCK